MGKKQRNSVQIEQIDRIRRFEQKNYKIRGFFWKKIFEVLPGKEYNISV
jgi:hypothetical protein